MAEKKTVCLIFSKNRSMQLRATIESFLLHCKRDIPNICVLYKTTSPLHEKQYEALRWDYPGITFQKETDFKKQLLECLSKTEFVLFLVDDVIFVRNFNLSEIEESMVKYQRAISFSLLLGRNTNYCYPKRADQKVPEFNGQDGILKYDWTKEEYDFGYPMSVAACVFFVKDIYKLIQATKCLNPNLLEGCMAASSAMYMKAKPERLCYDQSVGVCNPINLVQDVTENRVGDNEDYSAVNLAMLYEKGVRIDVRSYSGFVSNSAIKEMELKLETKDAVSSSIQ